MQVSLPPAPPIFRFSDPAECRNALTRAGFVDASVVEVPLKWRAPSIEAIIDLIYKGTVRTAAVLERQTPDAIDRIHRAIREGAERFMRDGAYEVAWPAVLLSLIHIFLRDTVQLIVENVTKPLRKDQRQNVFFEFRSLLRAADRARCIPNPSLK